MRTFVDKLATSWHDSV